MMTINLLWKVNLHVSLIRGHTAGTVKQAGICLAGFNFLDNIKA